MMVVQQQHAFAFSVDVEDWYQVENFKSVIKIADWPHKESRVARNVDRLLEILDHHQAKATFFILGWVADRFPHIVQKINQEGHEIASHGFGHTMPSRQQPRQFREDVVRAKALLEDLSGQEVLGYRAPSFAITDWAIDELRRAGYQYDSSVFAAFAHDRYGRLQAYRGKCTREELGDGFQELGIACLKIAGLHIPWGGGGYFRLIPYRLYKAGIKQIDRQEPFVFYIHPWEIDPLQPKVEEVSRLAKFRHYVGLSACEKKLEKMLQDFSWVSIRELLAL